jgi:transcriptional regulator with XRE-family HTH domain
MSTNVNDLIAALPARRRKKVEARADDLIAQEMTRRQLRRFRNRTQVEVAQALGVTQDSVSRLEQRTDLLLSTLRKYIQAMGGNLSILAEFPGQAPVKLAGLADENDVPAPVSRPRKRAKAFA